jgi:protein-ribulosamine 3-kinase
LPGHRQPERGRIVTDWSAIAADIAAASGRAFAPRAPRHVGGGCINSAAVLGDGEQRWFVKLNDAARLDMFEAERDGLEAMAATNSIRVPQPLCCGVAAGQAFIAMEYVPLGGAGGATAALAGEQLAAMHRAGAAAFGWHRENTIGATPQPNGWEADWLGSGASAGSAFNWSLPRRTATAGACSSGARGSWPTSARCSGMRRCRRCCMAICGAATWAATTPATP